MRACEGAACRSVSIDTHIDMHVDTCVDRYLYRHRPGDVSLAPSRETNHHDDKLVVGGATGHIKQHRVVYAVVISHSRGSLRDRIVWDEYMLRVWLIVKLAQVLHRRNKA